MKREVELSRRLRSLEALGQAFSALKGLSAHHFRQARNAVEPARAYREGVERLFRWSGAAIGAGGGGGAGLLVIGAELGLCGSYNAQLVDAGAARRAELREGPPTTRSGYRSDGVVRGGRNHVCDTGKRPAAASQACAHG
jgi:F0F1-type ATP synthase gamma subunit